MSDNHRITRTTDREPMNRSNYSNRRSVRDRLELPDRNYNDDGYRHNRSREYPSSHNNSYKQEHQRSYTKNFYRNDNSFHNQSGGNFRNRSFNNQRYYNKDNRSRTFRNSSPIKRNYRRSPSPVRRDRKYDRDSFEDSKPIVPKFPVQDKKDYDDRNNEESDFEDDKTIEIQPFDFHLKDDVILNALMEEFTRYGEFDVSIRNSGSCKTARVTFNEVSITKQVMHRKREFSILGCDVRCSYIVRHITEDEDEEFNVDAGRKSRSEDVVSEVKVYRKSVTPVRKEKKHHRDSSEESKKSTRRSLPQRKRAASSERRIPPTENPDSYKPNRSLFVTFIDAKTSRSDLRRMFEKYGKIEDMQVVDGISRKVYDCYIKFEDVDIAKSARIALDKKMLNDHYMTIFFGNAPVYRCIIVRSLPSATTRRKLEEEFDRFGAIDRIEWSPRKDYAFVCFHKANAAIAAMKDLHGSYLFGSKVKASVCGIKESRVPTYKADGTDTDDLDHRRTKRHKSSVEHSSSRHTEDKRKRRSRRHSRSESRSRSRSRSRSASFSLYPPKDRASESRSCERTKIEDQDRLSSASLSIGPPIMSLDNLLEKKPSIYSCLLQMKNSLFSCKMHLITGEESIAKMALNKSTVRDFKTIKITQRLRLDKSKFDEIMKNVESTSNYALLISTPDADLQDKVSETLSVDEPSLQVRTHKNLATYLTQKEAAGISIQDNLQTIVFPPSKFISEILSVAHPDAKINVDKNQSFLLFLIFSFST